jgi:hypothetical protein
MATTQRFIRERFLGDDVPFLVRFLTVALLTGGLIGGITNFLLLPGFWTWEMPPLAYRFLASAAAAYVVGAAITLTRPRWAESELLMVTVIVYGILLVGAVLLQPTLIDWSSGITWAFVSIVGPALLISIGYIWAMRDRASSETTQRLGAALGIYLLVVGLLALAVGALVFAVPKQSGFIWPWAALDVWKLLDSRLIACMLLTIGAGALLARWRNDRGVAQVFLAMLFAYCVVAGIGLILHAATTPPFVTADLTYVGIFAIVEVVGALLYPR